MADGRPHAAGEEILLDLGDEMTAHNGPIPRFVSAAWAAFSAALAICTGQPAAGRHGP